MALTSTEKANARLYLGYPTLFRYQNTRLESVLGDLDADAETLARSILTELTTLDAAIAAASLSGARGALKAVDEVEWYAPKDSMVKVVGFVERGRMLVTRLSLIFGVPLYGDYFGSYGYPGDTFSSGGVPGNGFGRMGGAYRLG